jgi:hypothetical protein
MTDQLPLFGAPQVQEAAVVAEATLLHRRTDSTGSKRAARDLVKSGRRDTHEAAVLEAVGRQPWCTSLELGQDQAQFLREHGIHDRTAAARRLKGLLDRGLVIRLDDRDNPSIAPCRFASSKCFRWALAGSVGAERWLTDREAVPVIDRGGERVLAMGAG